MGYIYTDIKPDNIMWRRPTSSGAEGTWCLIDFGHCVLPGTEGYHGTEGSVDRKFRTVTDDMTEDTLPRLKHYIETGERAPKPQWVPELEQTK